MDKPSNDNTGIFLIGFFAVGIVVLKIWQKVEPVLLNLYFTNRLLVLFTMAAALFWLFVILKRKIVLSSQNKKYVKEITNG